MRADEVAKDIVDAGSKST